MIGRPILGMRRVHRVGIDAESFDRTECDFGRNCTTAGQCREHRHHDVGRVDLEEAVELEKLANRVESWFDRANVAVGLKKRRKSVISCSLPVCFLADCP